MPGRAAGSPAKRLSALTVIWLLLFSAILVQIVRLQVSQPEQLVAIGMKQRIRATRVAADRGDLLDRNGAPLAMSVREWRLVADPVAVANLASTSTSLSQSLSVAGQSLAGLDPAAIQQRLAQGGRYTIVARGLDESKAGAIKALGLAGVSLELEPRRVYPAGDLARSILGRVDRTELQTGLSGLERGLDDKLRGKEGKLLVERNGRGQQIPAGISQVQPAHRGTSYELTLDRSLQYFCEGALARSIADSGAKSGIVAVSDPRTGDVLCLANMRVNNNNEVVNSEYNASLVDVYEPGSVNKVITIAAALEDKTIGASTTIVVPDRMQVGNHRFKDDEAHPSMRWTANDILAQSSNIGTIKIAQTLRSERIKTYLKAFGLGSFTGIGFPGESAGILPKYWTETAKATVPIGQGLAVTGLQMLAVYNTLANDGIRVPVRLVRGEVDAKGRERALPVGERLRVVSPNTAKTVTSMLESVVSSGTGRQATVAGYRVAGKTGTAQKPNLHSLGYQKDAYVASFAGFFPAESPRVSIIVILDEPKSSIYGGVVAAPLFAEVARFAGERYRIPPSSGTSIALPVGSSSNDGSVVSKELRAVERSGNGQRSAIRRAALAPSGAIAVEPSTIDANGGVGSAASTSAGATIAPATTVVAADVPAPATVSLVARQAAVDLRPAPTTHSSARVVSKRSRTSPVVATPPTAAPLATTQPTAAKPPTTSEVGGRSPASVPATARIPDVSARVRSEPRVRAVVATSNQSGAPVQAKSASDSSSPDGGVARTAAAQPPATVVAP